MLYIIFTGISNQADVKEFKTLEMRQQIKD